MPSKDKYTDPKLRDEVKEELHNSDKGGAPGQWSARKAQMMASEYKKRGGDYNTDKNEKDESQKNLSKWGEEDWQTKEGSGNAKKEDGTQKRYLPKKAWENMSEEEKKKTDNKKQEESKEGKQHVENTDAAKKSRRSASKKDEKNEKQVKRHDSAQEDENEEEEQDDGEEQAQQDDNKENEDNQDDEAGNEDDAEYKDDGEAEQDDEEDEEQEDDSNAKTGEKRGRSSSPKTSKKQKSNSGKAQPKKNESKDDSKADSKDDKDSKKTIGSKHMDAKEPAKKGSADRLPKKDQQVSWKAMPGYVQGKVAEILTKGKDVDGKSVKASEKDPKLVLKSDSSGKICVHKPDACYYD